MSNKNALRMKRITGEAKRLRKAHKNLGWHDALRQAGAKESKNKIGSVRSKHKAEKKTKVVRSKAPARSPRSPGFSRVVSGVDKQIGAIKKGSRFYMYQGVQIERMPLIEKRGRKTIRKNVFIVHGKVMHNMKDARAYIRHNGKA